MRRLGEDQLDDLALGAAVLGTGGGGNPYLGALLTKQVLREHGPVQLVTVPEVPEDALVVPTAEMGLSATPMALADEKGNTAVIETLDNHWAERLARSLTIDLGCVANTALYPLSGRQLKQAMIPGTISLAEELGHLIRQTRATHGDPITALLRRLGGYHLFDGTINDVQRRTETGFATGQARIQGTGPHTGSTLSIRFHNEHLIAVRDGQVIASVPDLIIILDADTGGPITTEELRYGLRVRVIAAPCDLRWRTSQGLALVVPRAFGYDLDYLPVEGAPTTVRDGCPPTVGRVSESDSGRAAFQVVVFPFRCAGQRFVYGLFRRRDAGYWQGVAGGGEAGESPLEAARREAAEETGVGDGAQFVMLDARAMLPVVAVTGEFSWGPQVLVIPEYAFGVGVQEVELRLSDEHTEYGWFGFQEARAVLRWDSNRTALWELDHRLRHGLLAGGA